MIDSLLYPDAGLLLLRMAIGLLFLAHGPGKIKGHKKMAEGMGKPQMAGFMLFLGLAETLGGIALILGFLTQWAALGLAIIMLGAIQMKVSKWHKKFTNDGGWELDWILFFSCLALALSGAGTWALDARLF